VIKMRLLLPLLFVLFTPASPAFAHHQATGKPVSEQRAHLVEHLQFTELKTERSPVDAAARVPQDSEKRIFTMVRVPKA